MFLTIIKSPAIGPRSTEAKFIMRPPVCNGLFRLIFGLALMLCSPLSTGADEPSSSPVNLRAAARAEAATAYTNAESILKSEPVTVEVLWHLGQACFDLAEYPEDKKEQAGLAERGISLCKQAVALSPTNAPAQYYLGLNYGQLSRTKGIGALRLVGPMQRAFEECLTLDETIDKAGPHRNLGYLFRDAPAWAGIGNRKKARHHLERAVKLAPRHMENWLALIEGRIDWGEKDKARLELAKVQELWPDAKARVDTAADRAAWAEWQHRLQKLAEKLR